MGYPSYEIHIRGFEWGQNRLSGGISKGQISFPLIVWWWHSQLCVQLRQNKYIWGWSKGKITSSTTNHVTHTSSEAGEGLESPLLEAEARRGAEDRPDLRFALQPAIYHTRALPDRHDRVPSGDHQELQRSLPAVGGLPQLPVPHIQGSVYQQFEGYPAMKLTFVRPIEAKIDSLGIIQG